MPGVVELNPIFIQSSSGVLLDITSTGHAKTEVLNSPSITNITGTVSLPTGAATSENQSSANTKLDTVNTNLGTVNTSISSTNSKLDVLNSSSGLVNSNLTTIDSDIKASQPRKLQDGLGNPIGSTDFGSGVIGINSASRIVQGFNSIQIEDKDNPAYKVKVDEAGNLLVKTSSSAPPNTIRVDYYVRNSVAGSSNSDTPYIIPPNTTIVLQSFVGGVFPYSSNASAAQLSYDASGSITTNSFLISFGYLQTNNYNDVISGEYTGNGTTAVILRRSRLDATARDMYARFVGYLRYNTYTTHDSGNSTSATASTMTDTSKAWTTNVHAGRYLMMNDSTPLKIASNTGTVLTLVTGLIINMLGVNPYKIVTFNA